MENYSKIRQYGVTILLSVCFFVLGVYIGSSNRPAIEKITGVTGKETAVETSADFSPFWEVWNNINEKYPHATNTSDQDRVYGAIAGLVGSLNDPYSVFFTPEESK